MVTLVPDTMVSNWVVFVVAYLSVVAGVPSSPSQARPTAFVTPGIRSSSAQNYPDNLIAPRASSRPPRGFSTPLAESAPRQLPPADRKQSTCTSRARRCYVPAEDGDSPENSSLLEQTTIEEPQGCHARQRQRQRRLIFRTVPPSLLAATTACSQASIAAVTGGRIGGGGYTAPDRAPSAPPMQQQQRYEAPTSQEYYSPRAGLDIYGSDGSRTHIKFSLGGRAGRRGGGRARFNPDVGDVTSTSVTPGDVVMIGGVTAGVVAAQRRNRRRFLEEGGVGSPGATAPPATTRSGVGGGGSSRETCVVTTLQLSTYCDRGGGRRDLLATLDKLSQTADVSGPSGLSALVNEVCLTLLRSERDWIGATGGIKEYPPDGRSSRSKQRDKAATPRSRAKRDFNRAAMRERSKWERETVSNTPERGFSSSTAPGWRRGSGGAADDATYAVATLLVAWSGLRSAPPRPDRRKKNPWFWQDGGGNRDEDRDSGFSVFSRDSALTLLEWLGDEAAEGRGENILDVEVLWTPADPNDSLDRDDLDAKWPELIRL